jgi:regulatory protein
MMAVVADLRTHETDHLQLVWQKKFGAPPADLHEAARQQRFLLQRGFSAELVSRFLRRLTTR